MRAIRLADSALDDTEDPREGAIVIYYVDIWVDEFPDQTARVRHFRVLGNDGARAGDLAGELNLGPIRYLRCRLGAFRQPTLNGDGPGRLVATSQRVLVAADTA